MNNQITLKTAVITVLVAAGLAFYGGMQYGKNSVSAASGGARFTQGGAGGTRGQKGPGNGGFVTGSILTKDDTSITVQLRQGGSTIVFYNPQTQVGKTVSGSDADLTVGENVMVSGSSNADGSVTAQTIQIRPASTTMPTR